MPFKSRFEKRKGAVSRAPATRHVTGGLLARTDAGKMKSHLKRPVSATSVKMIQLKRIAVPGGRGYPLNHPLKLAVRERDGRVTVELRVPWKSARFTVSASDFDQAKNEVGRRFDQWVQRHWSVPPHLRTEEDLQAVRRLRRLVNWTRYDAEDPVVQPMWGCVKEHLPDGAVRIFWAIGPDEKRNAEAILPERDVDDALAKIEPGQWFYGTAKCYPDHVDWDRSPARTPAPDDEQARAELWAGLPSTPADEPDCWPQIES